MHALCQLSYPPMYQAPPCRHHTDHGGVRQNDVRLKKKQEDSVSRTAICQRAIRGNRVTKIVPDGCRPVKPKLWTDKPYRVGTLLGLVVVCLSRERVDASVVVDVGLPRQAGCELSDAEPVGDAVGA